MTTLDKLRALLAENNTQTLQQLATSLGVTFQHAGLLCSQYNLERISPRSTHSIKRQLTINLPPDVAQWIWDKAQLRPYKSKNAVVNEAIIEYIENHKEG